MRGRPGMRASGAIVLGVISFALSTSCSSGGTDTQSFSPSSPADHTTSTSESPSSPSTHPTTSGPSTRVSLILAPTVRPAAQGAVDAAMAFINAYNAASTDPAHANLGMFNQYLTGSATKLFDDQLAEMKRAGLAYRGEPANPRLRVAGATPTTVALASCPLVSAAGPFTEYTVATRRPVPVKPRNPPPPYLQALTMRLVGGHWKLASLILDSSKTCEG
jgi:hypothetical protein